MSYIVKDPKEVERSLWSRIGAGINSHEVVRAKGGVVDVTVRERTMVLPAQRVLSRRERERYGKMERERDKIFCFDNTMKDLCGDIIA